VNCINTSGVFRLVLLYSYCPFVGKTVIVGGIETEGAKESLVSELGLGTGTAVGTGTGTGVIVDSGLVVGAPREGFLVVRLVAVGVADGIIEGTTVGSLDGTLVGLLVGFFVIGALDGSSVDGIFVGADVFNGSDG
jgi:hypothetical protein